MADKDASRRFSVDGLGWQPAFDDADVIFLQVGPSLVLALWGREGFVAVARNPSALADGIVEAGRRFAASLRAQG